MLANIIWYGKTGQAWVSSKYLFWRTIGAGVISAVFHVSYLIQAKKYKELKQFFLVQIAVIGGIYLSFFVL